MRRERPSPGTGWMKGEKGGGDGHQPSPRDPEAGIPPQGSGKAPEAGLRGGGGRATQSSATFPLSPGGRRKETLT